MAPAPKSLDRLSHRCKFVSMPYTHLELANLSGNPFKALIQFLATPLELIKLKNLGEIGFCQSFYLMFDAHPSFAQIFSRRACNSNTSGCSNWARSAEMAATCTPMPPSTTR